MKAIDNSFDIILKTTDLTEEEYYAFDADLFKYYWFLRVNKLVSLKLSYYDVLNLKTNGFFKSSALMHSIIHLTMDDYSKLVNCSPVDVAIQQLQGLPTCGSVPTINEFNRDSDWFSIQYGPNSINLPTYLWWLVKDIVIKIVGESTFFMDITSVSNGVPVIQLAFDSFNYELPKQIIEFDYPNTEDPIVECVDNFLNAGLLSRQFSYLEKATILYPLIMLYKIDHTWRYAFLSPLISELAVLYEPGDTFLDTLWKCLAKRVGFINKPTDHLYDSTFTVSGRKYDLMQFALNPKRVLEQLKGDL